MGWLGVADAPDWTLRVMIFSGEALDSLNMCYHPDEGQVLTITCAPYFPTCLSLRKRFGEAKIFGWIMNALKFIMILVRRISLDYCASSEINCWSNSWLKVVTSGGRISKKAEPYISSNPGAVSMGIVRFYDLTTMVDLLPLLLTENLEIVY